MFFYTFLPKLLNMSLTAGVAILFVLLLRLPLKRAPKVISYALWAVVLFRLLCPVSVTSDFSLFNLFDAPTTQTSGVVSSMEYVPVDIVHTEYPEVAIPVPGVSDAINEALPQGEEQLRADPLEGPMFIATYVWMTGVAAMAVYSAVTYIRLRRRLLASAPLRDNIYLADAIASPFVLGLIRPRIYLPSSLEEQEQDYIILHEQHHIRRFDHIVKALAFLALCIHWFNPLVWLAFVLSSKDMEMSCDEAVIKKLGDGVRADYSASLLSLATGRRIIAGVPLAFGEGDTKDRIKNLANWKKPAFWVVLVAILACIALAVGLLTNPAEKDNSRNEDAYYLRIGAEGVMEIEVFTPSTSGGAIHADGSPFELGEEVWLEMLDGVTDLRGVSITAMDKDGEILYALSIPESATDGEIVNIVGGDGWLLAPTAAGESSSIGIIGGADGPTAIFVSGGYHFGVTIERDRGVRGENLPNLAFHPLKDENPAYAHGLTSEQLAGIPLIPYTYPNDREVTISYTIYSGANAPENITLTDTAIGPDGSFLYVDENGQPIGQEAKFTRKKILGGERFTCALEPSQFNLAYSSTGPHETFRCFSLRYQIDGQWMEACFVLRTAEEYVNTAAGFDVAAEPIEQFRTDYIGDASKVSAIAQRLPYPDGYSYASIALQTDAPPYGLTVFMKGSGEIVEAAFQECADVAFDLIGNMGRISFLDENGDVIATFSRPEYIEQGSNIITPEAAAARYAEAESLFAKQAPWYDGHDSATGDWDGDGKEDRIGFEDGSFKTFSVELSSGSDLSLRVEDTAWSKRIDLWPDTPWGWNYYFDTGDMNGDGKNELVFALDTGTQGGDGAYCLLVCPTDGRGIEAFTQIETGQSYRIYWEKETDTLRLECKETGYVEHITERALIDPYLDTGEVKAQRIEWLESLGEDVPAGYADGVSGFVITDDGHIITSQYVTAPGGSHSEMFGNMLTEYAYGQDGQLQVLRAWFVHNPQE